MVNITGVESIAAVQSTGLSEVSSIVSVGTVTSSLGGTATLRLVFRSGTAAEWVTVNPTLIVGEVGYETDTKKVKIGDALTPWTFLDYQQVLSSPPEITVTKVKTSNNAKISSALLVDDPQLQGWALDPASSYKIKGLFKMDAGSGGGGDGKIAFQVSQTPVRSFGWTTIRHASMSDERYHNDITSAMVLNFTAGSVLVAIVVDCFLETHASLASVLDFQFAQNNSDPTFTTLYTGSYLSITKIA